MTCRHVFASLIRSVSRVSRSDWQHNFSPDNISCLIRANVVSAGLGWAGLGWNVTLFTIDNVPVIFHGEPSLAWPSSPAPCTVSNQYQLGCGAGERPLVPADCQSLTTTSHQPGSCHQANSAEETMTTVPADGGSVRGGDGRLDCRGAGDNQHWHCGPHQLPSDDTISFHLLSSAFICCHDDRYYGQYGH